MILYQTTYHFWWLRHGGSAIVALNTVVPGLVCAALTALLQYTDDDFCARLNNRNTASYTADELAAMDAAGGCDDVDYVVKWQHPYVHQAYTLCVTFLLTYRSQLAYQRFWEARTHMTVVSDASVHTHRYSTPSGFLAPACALNSVICCLWCADEQPVDRRGDVTVHLRRPA